MSMPIARPRRPNDTKRPSSITTPFTARSRTHSSPSNATGVRGLVVDIHGQVKNFDGIYRAVDGESVRQLGQRTWPHSASLVRRVFLACSRNSANKVLPGNNDRDQVEHFYNGGHITRSYGSDRIPDIDAIQVEFRRQLSQGERTRQKLGDLAAALRSLPGIPAREKKKQEAHNKFISQGDFPLGESAPDPRG